MRSVEELTDIIVDGLNYAVDRGFMLIRGEWGVKWDATTNEWVWDSEWCRIPGCDVLGAMLLKQPHIDSALHLADPDRAARLIAEPDLYTAGVEMDLETLFDSKAYVFIRNLVNGWDGEDYQGDGEDAYELGAEMSRIYRPMDIHVINLSNTTAQSEVRIRVSTDTDSLAELESLAG